METNFDNKCFVMMPISEQGDYPEEHFTKIYEQIFKPAIEDAGYQPYRVDENAISDHIINKIFSAIQECPMALCDLSNRNTNVLYELGLRQAYDKPVVLVQDEKTDKIFDISGISTVFYKSDRVFENVIDAREKIKKAIIDTKNGKKISMVKVVNAQIAKIPAENITIEDKMEIILSGISDSLKEIKDMNTRWLVENYKIRAADFSRSLQNNKKNFFYCKHQIRLKPDVTNFQINREIERLQEVFNIKIEYKIEGNMLKMNIGSSNDDVVLQVIDILLERVGNQNKN